MVRLKHRLLNGLNNSIVFGPFLFHESADFLIVGVDRYSRLILSSCLGVIKVRGVSVDVRQEVFS